MAVALLAIPAWTLTAFAAGLYTLHKLSASGDLVEVLACDLSGGVARLTLVLNNGSSEPMVFAPRDIRVSIITTDDAGVERSADPTCRIAGSSLGNALAIYSIPPGERHRIDVVCDESPEVRSITAARTTNGMCELLPFYAERAPQISSLQPRQVEGDLMIDGTRLRRLGKKDPLAAFGKPDRIAPSPAAPPIPTGTAPGDKP